jgi:predicted MFS family arabinose efflux permease
MRSPRTWAELADEPVMCSTAPAQPARGVRDRPHGRIPWQVLQHRPFRIYFAATLASNVGTWLQNTAQVLLAYQLAHSALLVGVVTSAQFAGPLFLGPWAAAIADRLDGKRLLVGAQLFSACVAAGMALLQVTGLLTEHLLITGALGLGLAFAFALPLQVSLVPQLSPEDEAESALAMNSVSYNVGRAVAPILCVVVINTMGFGWVFLLNAVTFLVLAVGLARVQPRPSVKGVVRPSRVRARDGLSVARTNPEIWLLLGMVAAVTIADDPVLVLGPTLAHRTFGVSNDWAGYFIAALGCGTVLGSLLPRNPTARPGSSAGLRRAALSLLALSIFMMLFVTGLSPAISLVAACGAGMAALTTGAATQVLLIRQSPGQAGSVMALWAIAWAGTKPIASLTDGWLATVLGVRYAGIALVLPAIVLALFGIMRPGLSQKGTPRPIRRPGQQEAGALIHS